MNQSFEMQSLKDRMAVQEKTAASQVGESLRIVAQFENTLSAKQIDFENRMKWYALVIAVAGLSWAIYKEAAPTTPPLSQPVVNI